MEKALDPGDIHADGRVGFDYIWWHEPHDAKVKAVDARVVHQPSQHFDHDMWQGRVDW